MPKKDIQAKNNKINIHEEYLQYHEKFIEKYGAKSIVLMQVGSFHECYSTDIRGPNLFGLSDLLNIVCTRKDKSILNIDEKNPYMLGFPSVAINKFLKILIDNNYTVIVIDQVTPPPNPQRSVTGIYSPSTFIDNVTTETKYLMTLYFEINSSLNSSKSNISVGMCAVDSTTGQVYCYEAHSSGIIDDNECWEEAQRFYHYFRPVELIIYNINNSNSDNKINISDKIDLLPNQIILSYNKINPNYTKLSYQNTLLKKVYPICNSEIPIEFLDLSKYSYAIISIINSFDYIYQHNENLIKELKIPEFFNDHKYMILGNNAQYQLNIIDYYNWDKIDSKFQSLNSVINNCATPMGKRSLKQRLCAPYTDIQVINKYYDLTEKMINLQLWEKVRSYLKGITDFDKLFRKLSIKYIQPYELYSIYDSLQKIISIIDLLTKSEFKLDFLILFSKSNIKELIKAINELENKFIIDELKVNNLIEVKKSFYLKGIYSEIDDIEDKIENGLGLINKLAKVLESFDTNITLSIKHNDRDGYYLNTTKIRGEKLELELKNNNKEINLENKKILFDDLVFTYHTSTCKISYKGLSDHSDEIEDLYSQLNIKIKELFYSDTINWYNSYSNIFKELINMIIKIDIITNNAYTSIKYHYSKPKIISEDESIIYSKNLRHPIIERLIDYEYVPHDVKLDSEITGNLIYGFNGIGKSSIMKAIGISIIMAQCGLYVPAESFEYGIFDSLYTRISGNDNLFKGHSSFQIEMNELRTILKKASNKTLVIGDEICRGTEYLSANAIVASAILKLVDIKAKFLFATHLHDLAQMDKIKSLSTIKFYHLSVENKNNELIFSRNLIEGTGEQIYGITVAQYILDDPNFINTAIELKNELLEKSGINTKLLSNKRSNYNKEIYMDNCTICGSNQKLESHHINWQKDFINSINGEIHKNKSHIIKDSKANLIILCTKCHDNLHNKNFTISGLVKTSSGIKILN